MSKIKYVILILFFSFSLCERHALASVDDENPTLYKKLLFFRDISIEPEALTSSSLKNKAAYDNVAKLITANSEDRIKLKKTTKNDIAGFEKVNGSVQGLFVVFKDEASSLEYLLYIRCYFRSDGDVPSTVERDMKVDSKYLLEIAGIIEEKEVIKTFMVLSTSSLACYLIDKDKSRIKEYSPFLHELLEGKSIILEADDGIY